MSGYVKTFKNKDRNKDNELVSFCIVAKKLSENYKTTWTKIEDLR